MRRRYFLIAGAATYLAGCAASGRLLPSESVAFEKRSFYRVRPLPHDPIVGEACPFDGKRIPDRWLLCDGRLLSAHEYPQLFAVLGHSGGRAPKGFFRLPKPASARFVIAAHGIAPRTPGELRAAMAKR